MRRATGGTVSIPFQKTDTGYVYRTHEAVQCGYHIWHARPVEVEPGKSNVLRRWLRCGFVSRRVWRDHWYSCCTRRRQVHIMKILYSRCGHQFPRIQVRHNPEVPSKSFGEGLFNSVYSWFSARLRLETMMPSSSGTAL